MLAQNYTHKESTSIDLILIQIYKKDNNVKSYIRSVNKQDLFVKKQAATKFNKKLLQMA